MVTLGVHDFSNKMFGHGAVTLGTAFYLTLEGIRLLINEIASFSGVPCKAIFGVKCVELTGFFSVL